MRTVSEKQLGKEFTEVLVSLDPKQHEPVFIHFQGKKFVVLREDEYQKISQKKEQNLTEFFRKSPLFGMDLDTERDKRFKRGGNLGRTSGKSGKGRKKTASRSHQSTGLTEE